MDNFQIDSCDFCGTDLRQSCNSCCVSGFTWFKDCDISERSPSFCECVQHRKSRKSSGQVFDPKYRNSACMYRMSTGTLPEMLDFQLDENGSKTVIARLDLPPRSLFGPFVAPLAPRFDEASSKSPYSIISSSVTGEICKFDLLLDSDENCNWMKHVRFSLTREDANLVAFQFCDAIFFVVVSYIAIGEELVVTYNESYSNLLQSVKAELLDSPVCIPELDVEQNPISQSMAEDEPQEDVDYFAESASMNAMVEDAPEGNTNPGSLIESLIEKSIPSSADAAPKRKKDSFRRLRIPGTGTGAISPSVCLPHATSNTERSRSKKRGPSAPRVKQPNFSSPGDASADPNIPLDEFSHDGADYTGTQMDPMRQAIAAVKNGQMSIGKAADEFRVSSTTLFRRLKSDSSPVRGRPPILTSEEEKEIVALLKACSEDGKRARNARLQTLLLQYSAKKGVKAVFCDSWRRSFMDRHPELRRPAEKQKKKRSRPRVLFPCKYCPAEFIRPELLKHYEIHLVDGKFPCPKGCPIQYDTLVHLETHLRQKHGDTQICEICGFSTTCKSALQNHQRYHEEKIYPCETCGAELRTPDVLRDHIARLHSDNPIRRRAPTKGPLRRNVQRDKWDTHFFKCAECQLGFPTKTHYTLHLDNRHPEVVKTSIPELMLPTKVVETYKCRVSGCAGCLFTDQELERHLGKHSEQDVAKARERKFDRLRVHEKVVLHGGAAFKRESEMYYCHYCDRAFGGPRHFLHHTKSAHPDYHDVLMPHVPKNIQYLVLYKNGKKRGVLSDDQGDEE